MAILWTLHYPALRDKHNSNRLHSCAAFPELFTVSQKVRDYVGTERGLCRDLGFRILGDRDLPRFGRARGGFGNVENQTDKNMKEKTGDWDETGGLG